MSDLVLEIPVKKPRKRPEGKKAGDRIVPRLGQACNYKFGLRTSKDPEMRARIDQEFRAVGLYYNRLIANVRAYLAAIEAARVAHYPAYVVARAATLQEEECLSKLREQIRRAKQRTRTRDVPPVLDAAVRAAKMRLTACYAVEKVARKEMAAGWKCKTQLLTHALEVQSELHHYAFAIAIIRAEQAKATADKREYDASLCHFSTKTMVARQVAQATANSAKRGRPPRFQPVDGTGRISIQLHHEPWRTFTPQGWHGKGKAPLLITNPPDLDDPALPRRDDGAVCSGIKAQITRHAGTRLTFACSPQYADKAPLGWELNLHRVIPEAAQLDYAHVVRERHGVFGFREFLILNLDIPHAARIREGERVHQEGIVAVNFGWRKFTDLGPKQEAFHGYTTNLRVAYVHHDKLGDWDIRLSPEIYARFRKCDELQAIVDKHNDAFFPLLAAKIAVVRETASEDFKRETETCADWESPYRFANLFRKWRNHPEFDAELRTLFEGWYHRWQHLWGWTMNQKAKVLRQRQDFYRRIAREIAATAKKVLLEDFDISKVAKLPEDDVKLEGGQEARKHRMWAAVSELRDAIARACQRLQCDIEVQLCEKNTKRCAQCGELTSNNTTRKLHCTCPKAHKWDQDQNNTLNQLTREALNHHEPYDEDVAAQ